MPARGAHQVGQGGSFFGVVGGVLAQAGRLGKACPQKNTGAGSMVFALLIHSDRNDTLQHWAS